MASSSKNKGKRWERKVAEHLSKIFELNFCRVPNSGAFVGGMNAFRKQSMSESQILLATGDIIVPDELKHIAIECKSYKDFSYAALFENNKTLNDWISQSKNTDKCWFLLFKITRSGSFVVFDIKESWIKPANFMIYNNCYICTMKSFFESNKESILNYKKAAII